MVSLERTRTTSSFERWTYRHSLVSLTGVARYVDRATKQRESGSKSVGRCGEKQREK